MKIVYYDFINTGRLEFIEFIVNEENESPIPQINPQINLINRGFIYGLTLSNRITSGILDIDNKIDISSIKYRQKDSNISDMKDFIEPNDRKMSYPILTSNQILGIRIIFFLNYMEKEKEYNISYTLDYLI